MADGQQEWPVPFHWSNAMNQPVYWPFGWCDKLFSPWSRDWLGVSQLIGKPTGLFTGCCMNIIYKKIKQTTFYMLRPNIVRYCTQHKKGTTSGAQNRCPAIMGECCISCYVSPEVDNLSSFDLTALPCTRASKLKQQIWISLEPRVDQFRQWCQVGRVPAHPEDALTSSSFFYLILNSSVGLWTCIPSAG